MLRVKGQLLRWLLYVRVHGGPIRLNLMKNRIERMMVADELRIALMLVVVVLLLLLKLLSPHVSSTQCRIASRGIFPLLRSCAQHVESGRGGSRLKGHGGGPSRLVAVGRMAI